MDKMGEHQQMDVLKNHVTERLHCLIAWACCEVTIVFDIKDLHFQALR